MWGFLVIECNISLSIWRLNFGLVHTVVRVTVPILLIKSSRLKGKLPLTKRNSQKNEISHSIVLQCKEP